MSIIVSRFLFISIPIVLLPKDSYTPMFCKGNDISQHAFQFCNTYNFQFCNTHKFCKGNDTN
eukprot:1155929-Pelagomonas_calceolata.AAC.3